MRHILFEDEAKAELRESAKYYDRQKPGLGSELIAEVNATLGFIREFPFASRSIGSNFRRTHIKRSPFDIIYALEEERIVIVAVMHHRRHPDYWKNRV